MHVMLAYVLLNAGGVGGGVGETADALNFEGGMPRPRNFPQKLENSGQTMVGFVVASEYQ